MYQDKSLFRIGRHTFNFWSKLETKDQHIECQYCNYSGCEYKTKGYLGHLNWTISLLVNTINSRVNKWISDLGKLDYSKIDDIEVDGIDTRDYPDFCDAYISSATYKGREMTDAELARLNEDFDYVYECVQERIY